MYDIIGNIVDESNRPIAGVIVDDGVNGTTSDGLGYYAFKTSKGKINFRFIGYKEQSFDLTKYKDGSSVNVDITLKPDLESTTYKALEIVAKRDPQVAKSNTIIIEEKGLTKKQMRNIGLGMIAIALVLTSVLVYKAVKK